MQNALMRTQSSVIRTQNAAPSFLSKLQKLFAVNPRDGKRVARESQGLKVASLLIYTKPQHNAASAVGIQLSET